MMTSTCTEPARCDPHAGPCENHRFELRFAALVDAGRGLAFPCDANGRVDLDALSDRARSNYFYARSTVGREYLCPTMRRVFRDQRP